jgi:hypothetical protein
MRKSRKSSRIRRGAELLLAVTFPLASLTSFGASQTSVPPSAPSADVVLASSGAACFSDGVACMRAVDCCSAGCVNGRCGFRNKPKRRLAARQPASTEAM